MDREVEVEEGSKNLELIGASKRICDDQNPKGDQKVCRICHFGREASSSSWELELISLGCDCKGELGSSHRHCAEAWFSQKGDRLCEICGKTAKNIRENAEETSIFMMEWNEMRLAAATLHASQQRSRTYSKQFMCNLVLACLVLVFLFLWFLRGINIL